MSRPPAGPLGCGLTQQGLAERQTPQESGDWPHSVGSRRCSQSYSFEPRLPRGPSREAGLSLSVWSGGAVIVAGRTAGLQGGQRATQRPASVGSIPTCRERDRAAGCGARGPGESEWTPHRGRGRGKQPASPPAGLSEPPRPSSGARGQRARSALRRRRGLGRKHAICLGKHPTSELGWQAPALSGGF